MTMHARIDRADQLIAAVAGSSEIGFAVLDNQLRYQMINKRLAAINGMPQIAHLGIPIGEIFADIFRQIAKPHYHRVLSSGQATHFEVADQVLPMRAHRRYWGLNANFPIRSRDGRIKQVGIFVVEITEQRKLQRTLRELSSRLSDNDAEKSFWYAYKIQACLDKYYEALGTSFEVLFRSPADSMEQLVHSVQALDTRLAAMRQMVTEVSVSFPVDMTDGQKPLESHRALNL
jgi:hypothetical protein